MIRTICQRGWRCVVIGSMLDNAIILVCYGLRIGMLPEESSGYPIIKEFLKKMHKHWF